ncbi:OPT family oligopeptide transporter [Acetobacter sp.]|jgi:putative OPT family oligopeptide transporter|uniref:OPT family oligopeptide transporter n=1 Tax=Acetobacter sp. TaxID=440 RepID=UPI0025BBFDE5|nr:oligopeptide transporter, OPT family [Acetobacter sp.]MCH4090685.1 oligopeptide transporter, OPT family [Acetobacter sp.]MCI1300128.1 oligopeptide transporter, OPT family [Acetobacter sp.]MCI1316546.1 oligopeptide transporter, OPT family [Acetobacter sp.]
MPHSDTSRELTVRGLVLGALITVVFTASNTYLGLKIGLTFASSIPAAVISMAVLRLLGGGSLLENNMVQSQASAAGTISTVFAVFPALILIGHWNHFPFLETAGLTAVGGMAGVLFTIPLRRALVNDSPLPYPEGVAAAEILRAGHESASGEASHRGLKALIGGAAVSAAVSFASGGLRLLTDGATTTFALGASVFRLSSGFSLALLGAGYLVGAAGGLAMLFGYMLSWIVAVPWLTATTPNPDHLDAASFATSVWAHKVRFIGAGAIATASLWTLGELAIPVFRGIRSALGSTATSAERGAGTGADTGKDLSARTIMITGALLSVALFLLFSLFLYPFTAHFVVPALFGTVFLGVFGFLTAATCGYMAGLVGSSSSPISGIVLLATVLVCSLLMLMDHLALLPSVFSADDHHLAIAFAMVILSAIVAAASISNDNLQDLKTGQLVGASPWRQEGVLLLGCGIGALVVPPVLNLLYQAYGFTGAMPRPDMDPTHVLAAPQPAIVTMIASGIFRQNLDWSMLAIGAATGMALVALDRILRFRKLSLPPLAVGIGIYLPPSVSTTLAVGACLGWLVKKAASRRDGQTDEGTMIASGLIVGESLTGVALAAVSGLTGSDSFLAVGGGLPAPWNGVAGLLVFTAVCLWFARRVTKSGGA